MNPSPLFSRFLILLLSIWFLGSTQPSQAAINVFVSIPPQKWLVDQIGKELVNTEILVAKGQDPHIFEPSPKQMAALSKSRFYFTIGLEFEEQLLARISKNPGSLTILSSIRDIEKIPAAAEEEHHDHGHDEATDPHVWLSPENLKKMAQVIAEALSASDAAHSDTYNANYHDLSARLDQLDRAIATELTPCKGASFFVFHPSFGYFAERYGLIQQAVEVEGKAPSPKQLSQLVNRARQNNIKILFVQPQFDPRSSQTIAAAIQGEVVPLDALAEQVDENLMTISHKIAHALAH